MSKLTARKWHVVVFPNGAKSPCPCMLAAPHLDADIGYVPEFWDVVRSDGVVVCHSISIEAAEDAAAYLNAKQNRSSYELHLA